MENTKKIYNTKQRNIILDFFKHHPEEKITAEDMLEQINSQETIISKATIYRNLDYLVNVGLIQKINLDNTCSCYIYCKEESRSVAHFCCDNCGKIVTIDNPIVNRLNDKLQKEYNFKIDNSKTILHGICQNCKAV